MMLHVYQTIEALVTCYMFKRNVPIGHSTNMIKANASIACINSNSNTNIIYAIIFRQVYFQ